MILKKLIAVVVFLFLFAWMLNLVEAKTFWQGVGLGLFDFVVIDLIWWRNTKSIRFSFLPEKALYQVPGKHIGSFLRGIPLFAAVVALTAGIVIIG